jgi:hypothetical protein
MAFAFIARVRIVDLLESMMRAGDAVHDHSAAGRPDSFALLKRFPFIKIAV